MMMVPNYEKLFEPYTADGATLEGTLKWLKKTSNASEMVIGQVLSETMLKLAEGYEFDRKKCHCGCGLTNAHTSIEHYMLAQVKALEEKANKAYADAIQAETQAKIAAHIALENQRYIAENTKPSLFKRIKNGLFCSSDKGNVSNFDSN